MIEKRFRDLFPKYSPEVSLNIRRGSNSKFHEAILWEYSIHEMSRYIQDFTVVFKGLRDFVKYRGTVTSIKLALSWVGFPKAKFIRLSNTSFEIDAGSPFTTLQIKAIQSACLESAPARGTLKRIFHLNQSVSL